MVLFDYGELAYIFGAGMELQRHVRIKILSDKGLDEANIKLPYHSYKNDEEITDISAQTYNLDGSGNVVVTKVDKKLIYDKKINKRYSEKVFTFPEAKAGSVIEYKYKLKGAGLIDWYFQESVPVKHSRFVIDFPQEIEVRVTPFCSRPYERTNDQRATRVVQTFAMKNIPAFRDEGYIINEDDYRDRVETIVSAFIIDGRRENRVVTWPMVTRFLMEDEDFGQQIKKEIPRTADLDAELRTLTDPYLRMKTIHHYVQNNMEWNGSPGMWALDGVKAAWKDKKGTQGEINLILVNLLKDAGLNAKPLLASTHDNGMVNTINAGTYDYPGFNQFNKVLAYVEIGNKAYVLDATDKETPCHLIPPDLLMTEALVIEKLETFEWGWKSLWDGERLNKNLILLNGTINADGKMEGNASINSYDYSRLPRVALARKDKKAYIERFLSISNPGITIDSVSLENLDSDSLPLIQKINFNQTLSSSGDYRFFSANIFTGLEKNPFVADTRICDVFFGANQHYSIIGNFTIPADYQFEEMPKNVRIIMPDTSISISRLSQASGNRISFRITLDFKKPFFSASEYPEFQAFYKKMFDMLNEQYVIRKKENP